jgi:hypothetical protein
MSTFQKVERVTPKISFTTSDPTHDIEKKKSDSTFGIRRDKYSFVSKSYTPGPGFYNSPRRLIEEQL